ncbi:MAG: phosphoglucosamine mutase [Bacteroidetes bacterium]|nr:phosphoglucosamine mutase [Bacteroidota bacterium]
MTLIKSISGIRGTIGGKPGEGLNPLDIVKFTAAFGTWISKESDNKRIKMVVGRDARVSGEMVNHVVNGTLIALGIDVVNIGLATTPTVELAVQTENADGGIILTASHNPGQWNALKLLNNKGEFITARDGTEVIELADKEKFEFSQADQLGKITANNYNDLHIDKILKLDLVDRESIRNAGLKIVVDCVNSVGGIVIPELLKALGVKEVVELYCSPTGIFPHNPEPVPENLTAISKKVKETGSDLGFVVDPDVDRLAIVDENGMMFGEEYTLVAIADHILNHKKGNTVSNLSSSMALKDITEQYGGKYFAAAVGEVNVIHVMKEKNAVIGGEGNGGVIYPDLHYGRDALVGIGLFLSHLVRSGKSCSALRTIYPDYHILKRKIQLTPEINVDRLLEDISYDYKEFPINLIDGVRIDFPNGWVHLRKSNTEPIIRLIAEGKTSGDARELSDMLMNRIDKNIASRNI